MEEETEQRLGGNKVAFSQQRLFEEFCDDGFMFIELWAWMDLVTN